MNPDDFIITRKRKKYKFALFAAYSNCYLAPNITKEAVRELSVGRDIVVEMGAGTAFFALALAKLHPEKFYIACDVKADRLQKGAKRAIDEGIDNIIFVRSHIYDLDQFISPHSVKQFWLTFSDPFPKTRHAKHRLTHPLHLATYQSMLTDKGSILQKTDSCELFEWSLEQYVENKWVIRELSFDLHGSDLSDEYKIQTTFEKRFVKEGFKILFVKVAPH